MLGLVTLSSYPRLFFPARPGDPNRAVSPPTVNLVSVISFVCAPGPRPLGEVLVCVPEPRPLGEVLGLAQAWPRKKKT